MRSVSGPSRAALLEQNAFRWNHLNAFIALDSMTCGARAASRWTQRGLAIGLVLLGSGAAQACNSTPDSSRRTVALGRDWAMRSCARGADTDCVDVINSVIRTIQPFENCPGLAPGEVAGLIRQLQAMAGQAPDQSRREAKQRYEDRMAPPAYAPSPSAPLDPNNGRNGWQPRGTYCSRFTSNADGSIYCY